MPRDEKREHAVADGKINYLSVSQVEKFDNCQVRWWFNKVKHISEPTSKSQAKGTQIHSQLEHYLTSGEDVLSPTARAGKHLLPVPGPGLFVEQSFEDGWPLSAAGVRFIGYMDLINIREEHILPNGSMIHEPGTIEVHDHKTTKNFKYAKSDEELPTTIQMSGYGEAVRRKYPQARYIRFSHLYLRTEGAHAALKKTGVAAIASVAETWSMRVEPIVEQMKVVAALVNENDVPANLSACSDFGGCPHRSNCSHFKNQNIISKLRSSSMGLLAKVREQAGAAPQSNGATAPATAIPPPPSTSKMKIQDNSTPGLTAKQAIQGSMYKLPNGSVGVFLCTTEGKGSFLPLGGGAPCLLEADTPITLTSFPNPTSAPAPAAIPPPSFAPVAVAAPPAPPSLTPPAPVAVAAPPAPAAEAAPTGGGMKKRGRPSKAEVAAREAAAEAPVAVQAVVPPSPPAPAVVQASIAPPAPVQAAPQVVPVYGKAPQAAPAGGVLGIRLYVNCVPNGPFESLDKYVGELTHALEEQHEVQDIRCAPDKNSPLAYAQWAGVLASFARKAPPEDGVYVAFSSAFTDVVVEALAPLCAPGNVIRSIR